MAKWWSWQSADSEIDEELETHLALETDRQIGKGMTPPDAHDAAVRRFGNLTRYKEATREVAGLVWWEHLRHDLHDAWRAITSRKLASSAAIIALGIGMGGPTTAIAVVMTISTAVFPGVQNADQLVMLWETPPHEPGTSHAATRETLRVWQAQTSLVQGLSITQAPSVLNLSINGAIPHNTTVQPIAVNLLPMLGVTPASGRPFVADDDRPDSPPVALLSDDMWYTRFGGHPDTIGSEVLLDGRPTTIVGIMPRGFWFASRDVDLWVPLPSHDTNPAAQYHVVAQMRPGDTQAALSARVSALAEQVAAAHPARERGWSVRVESLGPIDLFAWHREPGILMIITAAMLGLIVAFANIAMVMVARGAARQKESAVRSALGARRGRLIRQFITESVVVSLAGGTLALSITYAAMRLLVAIAPADLTSALNIELDWRVAAGTIIVSLIVGVLSGLAPALTDSRVNVVSALKETGYFGGSSGPSRLRRTLIVAELAITVMLLCSVGLLARGVADLGDDSPGFDPTKVLTVQLNPVQHIGRAATPPPDADLLMARVRSLNGVEAVAAADAPLPGMVRQQPVHADATSERDVETTRAGVHAISPTYFEALGLRVVAGRTFAVSDRTTNHAAVVSQAFANRRFPGGGALGQTIRIGDETAAREIVGIVSDVRIGGGRPESIPVVYVPFSATAHPPERRRVALIIRTTRSANVLPEIRRIVIDIDPAQTLGSVWFVKDLLDIGIQERRLGVFLTGPIVVLALLLAVSGIYGLLAQTVSQRTHELAVRAALGASRRNLLSWVLAHGLKLAGFGAIVGMVGAVALERVLGSFLFGLPQDLASALAAASLIIVLATLVASIIPCRRALHINPGRTLRYE